jgi:8-hydroxy-5-deazaflavin:NADPH oxidoreductase
MRIGCIGAGNIGQAVATRAVAAGHEVMLSNSRGPETLAEVEQSLGQAASAGTVEQAAAFGEVVLVATPLAALDVLPATALDGKLVIDANNYYPGRDGQIEEIESGATGSSELLARRVPGARVVKAFNTMRSDDILHRGRPAGAGDRLALPVAGDDVEAKHVVMALIDDFGFDGVDAGTLADGRRQQPGTPVYGATMSAAEVRRTLELA